MFLSLPQPGSMITVSSCMRTWLGGAATGGCGSLPLPLPPIPDMTPWHWAEGCSSYQPRRM